MLGLEGSYDSVFFHKERERHSLVISSPALLCIDLQSYFCKDSGKAYLFGVEQIIPKIDLLISVFEKRSLPVICTVHEQNSDNMQRWWKNTIQDDQTELCVNGKNAFVLKKNTYDAFYNTKLEEFLKEKKIDQLFVTGVMTHLCVETTVRSAFVRGFDVSVVFDACWDKDDWYHFSSLKNMAHGFATIVSTEELICALQ